MSRTEQFTMGNFFREPYSYREEALDNPIDLTNNDPTQPKLEQDTRTFVPQPLVTNPMQNNMNKTTETISAISSLPSFASEPKPGVSFGSAGPNTEGASSTVGKVTGPNQVQAPGEILNTTGAQNIAPGPQGLKGFTDKVAGASGLVTLGAGVIGQAFGKDYQVDQYGDIDQSGSGVASVGSGALAGAAAGAALGPPGMIIGGLIGGIGSALGLGGKKKAAEAQARQIKQRRALQANRKLLADNRRAAVVRNTRPKFQALPYG